MHGREGDCVYVSLTKFEVIRESRADRTVRPVTIGEKQEQGERLALGFTSPLVFVDLGPPLVSHFITWKSFISKSRRFGAFIKNILVDIIFSKDLLF